VQELKLAFRPENNLSSNVNKFGFTVKEGGFFLPPYEPMKVCWACR